jgi:hypothetical protein
VRINPKNKKCFRMLQNPSFLDYPTKAPWIPLHNRLFHVLCKPKLCCLCLNFCETCIVYNCCVMWNYFLCYVHTINLINDLKDNLSVMALYLGSQPRHERRTCQENVVGPKCKHTLASVGKWMPTFWELKSCDVWMFEIEV